MFALLCKTKAWTVFDQTAPNLEPESLASVAVALQSLGVDSVFIADAWQEKLLNKYIRLAEANSANISELIIHLLQECVDGAFSMSMGDSDKASCNKRKQPKTKNENNKHNKTNNTTNKHQQTTTQNKNINTGKALSAPKLKQRLNKFFSAIRKYRATLASGSLAKPMQVADVLAGVQGGKKEITPFGQELAAAGAITPSLTLEAIEVHLDSITAKLGSVGNSNISANQNALKKLDHVAAELIRLIDIKTEKELNKY